MFLRLIAVLGIALAAVRPAWAGEDFMLRCTTGQTPPMIFLLSPDSGVARNLTSFPKSNGVLYISDVEYLLSFVGAAVGGSGVGSVQFVVNRYTGKMFAVANGTMPLFEGHCRKGKGEQLF
ncbi:MAG: hypothetical protein HQL36_04235 [Alphaproteobacteria bacterium]|nr:hypothetical protein [Alphaproteobacteria bacterium]MBF0251085.1 hypothetical protein [Alphaproteobacteria bacterium]